MRGFVYVAYGDRARREVHFSIQALRRLNDYPFTIISDQVVAEYPHIYHADTDPGARLVKLNMDLLSPFDETIYLDADTRPNTDFTPLFDILDDGWELVIALNQAQDQKWLWNITPPDRQFTLQTLDYKAMALQGGLIGFRKTEAVHQFFTVWRSEWARFTSKDQGALLRALHISPVKLWVLGSLWNGGALMAHNSGKARRSGRSYR